MTIFVARIAPVTLVTATTRTLIQIVASTKPCTLKEIGISFDGTDSTKTPVEVDIVRQTSAGSSSSLTLLENQEIGESPLASALQTFTSTEPTTTDVLRSWYVTPAGGTWAFQWPMGDEIVIGPSGRLGLRVISASGVTPNALAYMVFNE